MSEVPLLWNHAENPVATLVLAHGAGVGMDSEFMNAVAALMVDRQISVVRFEFPYMRRRRDEGVKAPPDRAPKLLDCFEAVINQIETGTTPVFIGGKSMGGRMATMLAAQRPVSGCVVFGYPFHPPGKPEKTRLEHFPDLKAPVLICQGERDPFGKPGEVSGYPLPQAVTVTWIEEGDHDLKPRKASGLTQQQQLEIAVSHAADFIKNKSD